MERDIFRIIATGEQEDYTGDACPLTEEEKERAGSYARFLGEVVYRRFLSDLRN